MAVALQELEAEQRHVSGRQKNITEKQTSDGAAGQELVRITTLMQMFDCSRASIYRMHHAGVLPLIKTPFGPRAELGRAKELVETWREETSAAVAAQK